MFFQVSPVTHKKIKPVEQKKPEPEEIEVLSLAPFTKNPKIIFENVAVGTTQQRNLIIKNPTTHDINLFIKNSIPSELNFFLSWNEAIIEKGREQMLEMLWTPTQEEASRYTFVISDGKRINRNIGVTFKAAVQKEARKATKPIKNAVKLPLIRRPVSPVKKLRPSKYSPIRNNHSSLKHHNSPSLHRQHINDGVQHNSQKEYPYYYGNMKTPKENKENALPVTQENICYKNGSFVSPNNNPFFVDINAYKFNPEFCERRDTYVVGKENTTWVETTESFYLQSKENSPYFRDSLDAPKINLLRERNDFQDKTPTLESLVQAKRRLASGNFEDRLKVNAFSFSPRAGLTPKTEETFKFTPTAYSTSTKPPSTENSKIIPSLDLSKVNINRPSAKCDLNQSNETYTKGNSSVGDNSFETYLKANASDGTYVKGNISGETYTKGNVSGETYVKDSSVGNLAQLDVSPVSTRTFLMPSPTPKMFEASPISEYSTVGTKLSIIAEESIIINERHSRITAKRKSPIVSEHPPKREKLSPNWLKCNKSAFRLSTSSSGLNLNKYLSTSVKEHSPLARISEITTKTLIVKNPFLYANIIDPFMTSQIYSNEEWIEQQMHNFKKWLNALLTPPDELNTKTEIDVAKVWQECTKKDVSEAPTKEALSLKCHTNKKLDYVRKQAQQLFRSAEMSTVLQKVCLVIEAGKLSIREDKDLHLNIRLKSDITRLILGYNPLWLRIGLETIYNEIIPMRSNSDTHTLATFILERLLKNPHLTKKHKTIYAPKYSTDLKKFILKKFLILVYFLDRAKSEKLIQHDPCLFCKNAIERESKLVLTHFARETLSAVGDVTKYLKCLGYVVTHVQQYIHEFDYAVKNLGTDLRDGVRLTRVMEIIQMRNDLTMKLRVPAISRLQKVHNMQLVFKSLQDYGYEIQYDISPKDIVDGHREKNLSFLWQIIYKFEAPLMVKSATTIQTWFRSLPVQVKRSQLRRARENRENAAKRIQLWYRRQKLAEKYIALGEFVEGYIEQRRQHQAAVKIQSFFRMRLCRRRFVAQYRAVIMLQTYAKGWLIRNYQRQRIIACVIIQKVFRGFVCRKRYLMLKKYVIYIQQRLKGNKIMRTEKMRYDRLKQLTIMLQGKFRAFKQMKPHRRQYLAMKDAVVQIQSFCRMYIARKQFTRLKDSAILIQRTYRAQMQMKSAFSYYLSLKQAACFIQQRFRANKEMNICRYQYMLTKSASIKIQSFYRMYRSRNYFAKLRSATLVIQARFRSLVLMKYDRDYYLALRNATIKIQSRFRANVEMKKVREVFMFLRKTAIKLQSFYRMYTAKNKYLNLLNAAKVIQQRYRAQKAMQAQYYYYNKLLTSVISVQQRFRANVEMKRFKRLFLLQREVAIKIQNYYRMYLDRKKYLALLKAAKAIQQRYRAQRAMQVQHCYYNKLLTSATFVQRSFRANIEMKRVRQVFLHQKEAVIQIQSYYRMNTDRKKYLNLLKITRTIQQRYRAQKAMQVQHRFYNKLLTSLIFVQRRFRANVEMKRARNAFTLQRDAAKKIQSYYRMYTTRTRYINLQKAVKVIQQRYRAQEAMKLQHCYYNKLLTSVVYVQSRFRANNLEKQCRKSYLLMRHSSIVIQVQFKMLTKRREFLKQKKAIITIQRWYRASVAMKQERDYYNSLKLAAKIVEIRYQARKRMQVKQFQYNRLKQATIIIQTRYRSLIKTRKAQSEYLAIKHATVTIQARYRANLLARRERHHYAKLKNGTVCIQRRLRAIFAMRMYRAEFEAKKTTAIFIQRRYRAHKEMVKCRTKYVALQQSCIFVQRKYRAQKCMLQCLTKYNSLKQATIFIQQRFRANVLARQTRLQYQAIRNATLIIQRTYKAKISMQVQRQQFLSVKRSTIIIQQIYRAVILMRQSKSAYLALKQATVLIQRKYRALLAMEHAKENFEKLKRAAIIIQRRYRANVASGLCRQNFLALRQAAIKIQTRFRSKALGLKQMTEYSRIKWAAIVLQRRYRAERAMKEEMSKYTTLRSATFIIQRRWRATCLATQQRKIFLLFKLSIMKIQKFYKSYLWAKRQREWFLRVRSAAVQIQRFGRGYLVRKKCTPLLTPDAVESRRLLKLQSAAAVKIQALFRGHRLRKSKIPQLVALRKRLENQQINQKPTGDGMTLEQRYELAMTYMVTDTSLLMVQNALEDIVFISRHSQNLCICLSQILSDQLYVIIMSAARSLPEMKALNTATLVLINFCKYPKTRENSWNPEYMDGLINVMLHWCDKEVPLFSTLCTLVWLFGHENKWKKVIISLPNIQQRFVKIQSLVNRKQSMVIKSKKINRTSPFGPANGLKLPSKVADWGLDYDRPNTFTNAVFALTNVLKVLDL